VHTLHQAHGDNLCRQRDGHHNDGQKTGDSFEEVFHASLSFIYGANLGKLVVQLK
jgi:hypothetical protein